MRGLIEFGLTFAMCLICDMFCISHDNKFMISFDSFSRSLIDFGLSFTTSSLPGGNDYLNLALIGMTGIPATFICIVSMEKMGRRHFVILFTLLSSAFLIVATFLPKGTYTILLKTAMFRNFKHGNFRKWLYGYLIATLIMIIIIKIIDNNENNI